MKPLTDKHFQAMLDHLIGQLKYFLTEGPEFYPFGSIIDADLQVKPLGFFSDAEYPEATEVLKRLEAAVKEGLQNGKFRAAAIGVSVMIDGPQGSTEKKSALEVRTYPEDGNVSHRYCVYEQTPDGYEFGELMEL